MVAAPTVFDHCSSLEKEDNREKEESEKKSERARGDRRASIEEDRERATKKEEKRSGLKGKGEVAGRPAGKCGC